MKIIAHATNTPQLATKALGDKIDFLEVDVSQRIIFSKFTTQHHGVLGKFGIGSKLELLFDNKFRNKLFLDLKHAKFSHNFITKLSNLLKESKIKNARICGFDWQVISVICKKNKLLPFYSIYMEKDLKKIKKLMAFIEKPAGFSIYYKIINKKVINYLKETFGKKVEIWAWTVNDKRSSKKLTKLGVDGIITDNWSLLARRAN